MCQVLTARDKNTSRAKCDSTVTGYHAGILLKCLGWVQIEVGDQTRRFMDQIC